jgi:hypothetical protein
MYYKPDPTKINHHGELHARANSPYDTHDFYDAKPLVAVTDHFEIRCNKTELASILKGKPDLLRVAHAVPVVSPRLKALIESSCPEGTATFFPVPVLYKGALQPEIEVYIANILRIDSAIDLQKSRYSWFLEKFPESKERVAEDFIWHFHEIVALPDDDERPLLFREASKKIYLCCNEAFRTVCRKAKMRLSFMELESLGDKALALRG